MKNELAGHPSSMKQYVALAIVAATVVAAAAVGCAKGGVNFDETETPGPTGAGGGGGGAALPCGVDCSTIATADCQQAVCNEMTKQCAITAREDLTPCDDGLFCTVNDHCQAGTCVGPDTNGCGMNSGPCDSVSCNESSQTCSVTPVPNGTACTPTNLCQSNATCSSGLCLGTPTDCFFFPVPNDCYVGQCNPMNGLCEAVIGNEGLGCIDTSDLCTVGKTCTMGTCQGGGPKDCSALSVGCNNGLCNVANGQCVAQPVMQGQPCLEATDDCNQGLCNNMAQCIGMPINQGMMCDDGLSCTTGTTCNNGVCGGGMSSVTIYFSDDFSSNSAGWTLGTEWQIGPATISSGEDYGFPDPATDHSTSSDDGVAGVAIGGNAGTNLHTFYYLTSPVVNTANTTTLFLEFWRWLNSDYTPFMQNVVEVYNGTSWVSLWQSGGSPGVQDNAWTKQSFDISAHKNANMQVRFGFDISSSGVFIVSQWNVDDVVIASAACN